ncbi:MAG: hypothetical protein R3F43_32665, partial [bacterium]
GEPQSGVQVLQQGLDEIVVVNHYRRRAHAFVERTAATFEDGRVEPRDDALIDFAVASVSNPASIAAALADAGTVLGDGNSAFTGNVAWVDTVSAPVALPVAPADAVSTRYRVVVVGPGRPRAEPIEGLKPAMEAMLRARWLDTLALDVLLPAFQALAGPLARQAGGASLDEAGLAAATTLLKDLASLLLADVTLQEQLAAGDVDEALLTVVKTVMQSEVYASARNDVLRALILHTAPNADAAVVEDFLKGIGQLMGRIDLALQGADWAAVALGIGLSRDVEVFDVDVSRARAKLTPGRARLGVLGSAAFQATVPDATGDEAPLVTWRFRLVGGGGALQLRNPVNDEVGVELGSSTGAVTVESTTHDPVTAELEAEAILDGPGAVDASLGTAYASIQVVNDKAVAYPARSSLRPGQRYASA